MSTHDRYGRKRLRRLLRPSRVLSGLGTTTETVAAVATDPYLSEVICRVGQLRAINDKTAVPGCVTTRANLPGGVGLSRAMKPLRAYVYAEQHKWIYAVAALGIIGLPLLVGYELGRKGH